MDWIQLAMMPSDPQGGGSLFSMFIPLAGMMLIFYFLLIRPQQKRQKESQRMIEALRKGDRIVTSSGLYGTIVGIKDNIVVLKIADDVKVEMAKSSVSGLVEKSSD